MEIIDTFFNKLFLSDKWTFRYEKDGVRYFKQPTPFKEDPASCGLFAAKMTVFVPGVKPKAVEKLLLDDERMKEHIDRTLDKKTILRTYGAESHAEPSTISTPDAASGSSPLLCWLVHSKFKSPFWGIAPRDMVTKVLPSLWLSPEEQQSTWRMHHVVADGTPVSSPTEVSSSSPVLCEPLIKPSHANTAFLHLGVDASREHPEEQGYQRAALHCFGFVAQEAMGPPYNAEVSKKNKGSTTPITVADGSKHVHGTLITSCFSVDPAGSLPKYFVSLGNYERMDRMGFMRDLLMAEQDTR